MVFILHSVSVMKARSRGAYTKEREKPALKWVINIL